MRTAETYAVVLLLLAPACKDASSQDDTAGVNTGGPSASSSSTEGGDSADTGPGTAADTGAGTADDSDPPPGFVDNPDAGSMSQCDVWSDDCPEGEKCMPWADNGGSSWNATRCSPVQSDPDGVGDTCTVEDGGTSGSDSCGARSMCYYVDSETGTGLCVAFCAGSPRSPSCDDPGDICTIANDGVLTVCRPSCDPLLQDCVGDAVCMQAPGALGFTCMIDISDGDEAPGDPCEYNNSCPPGLTCEPAEGIPGCKGARCCTPWCDLAATMPDEACTLTGQACLPFEADAPPGLEEVGICLLPPS